MVYCPYNQWMWRNCITVSQIHHMWLMSPVCEHSLLRRSGAAELVAVPVQSSASAALLQLLSFWQGSCLFSNFFSKYLGLDKKPWLWGAGLCCTISCFNNNKMKALSSVNHPDPFQLAHKGMRGYFNFPQKLLSLTDGAVFSLEAGAGAVTLVLVLSIPDTHTPVLAGEIAARVHCRKQEGEDTVRKWKNYYAD